MASLRAEQSAGIKPGLPNSDLTPKWSQVVARAEAWRVKSANKPREDNHQKLTRPLLINTEIVVGTQQKSSQAPTIELDEPTRAGIIAQGFSALEKFRVEDTLTIIRDEIWHGEGSVKKVVNPMARNRWTVGFRLDSDPFLILKSGMTTYEGGSQRLWMSLSEEQASIEIALRYVDIDGVREDSDITLTGSPIYSVKKLDTIDLAADIRNTKRLSPVLERWLPKDGHPSNEVKIPYSDEDAPGQLDNILVIFINQRSAENSHPASIREATEERLARLPRSIQQRTELGETELRAWAHKLLGTPLPFRAIDRLFPVGFKR